MNKYHPFFFVIILFILVACSSDTEPSSELNLDSEEIVNNQDEITAEETDDTEDAENDPVASNLRTFIFGHSLIVHDPPAIPTPSNETTVPHWMAELSSVSGFGYAVSGQYGFLPQHADLPPTAQWGFDRAQSAWESETESFNDANFNSILLTAGNFIQYRPATLPYEGDNSDNTTPVGATLEIFDWVEAQEPGMVIYIYENWPDMAGFLNNGVPASALEFENYNDYTLGEFHDWWLAYYESVVEERPNLSVKLIPVGPIISKLLTETELSSIPFSELYEDDAPHGRPTIYFLASLVTYMAMYGVEAPANFQVPDIVNELVRTNYTTTVEFIWNQLEDFNDSTGNSLVFAGE